MQLNLETQSNHKFILIQLPEPCNEKEKRKAAIAAGFRSIADLTKARVRKVIKKYKDNVSEQLTLGVSIKKELGFPSVHTRGVPTSKVGIR